MSKAKNWAIVVGINKYPNIGQLAYANRDAEAMAAFFRSVGFDRVFCFADELAITPEPDQKSTLPIASDLVSFLHDRFTTQTPPLKAGDNCWFFFAGHGKRIKDADCLLPLDYNPRLPNHENFAIPVALVREALLKSGADNVILLLDACRTEGDRDADGLGIGDEQPGAITIFSCERNKKAYEIDDLQHGAFTAALLEGLKMPKSAANCATVQRLDRHLRDRVPQLCQQYQKPIQNPNTTVDPGQKWYFLLLPKVATEQDILALENKAQGAELAENWDLAEQLWIRCVAATGGEDLNALDGYARVRGTQANRRSTGSTPSPQAPTASRSTPTPTKPAPAPPQKSSAQDDLSSEKGIDYTCLRGLLKAQNWKAADQETYKVMIRVVGKQSDNRLSLTEDDLSNFSCTDLLTIDRLWVKYSNGKFGFSVQQQIWQRYGSPGIYGKDWEEFCVAVGWRKHRSLGLGGYWTESWNLTFNLSAPKGHLPSSKESERWDKLSLGISPLPDSRGRVGSPAIFPFPIIKKERDTRPSVIVTVGLFSQLKTCKT